MARKYEVKIADYTTDYEQVLAVKTLPLVSVFVILRPNCLLLRFKMIWFSH